MKWVVRMRACGHPPVVWKIGSKVCVTEVAQYDLTPPELEHVVLMLSASKVIQLGGRMAAVKARSHLNALQFI